MATLVLGTAQLGMNYGIANRDGKPSIDEAFEILDLAYTHNIKLLDTASAYGEAEALIGNYVTKTNNRFEIATKLPKLDVNDCFYEKIEQLVLDSIRKLNVPYIEKYFLHDFNMLLSNPRIFTYLNKLKDKNLVKEIGISIYTPEEMDIVLEKFNKVDIIQIPYNIFDQRWKEDLLAKAKANGIKIFARSVYLQGLFFADKITVDRIHKNAINYINKLDNYCKNNSLSIDELALGYVNNEKYIDYIIIGAENKNQVLKNIELYNKTKDLYNKNITLFVKENFSNVETKIIDPRLW